MDDAERREQIGDWRIRYALGSHTGGRPLARAMLVELGGAIPTAEEIASVGGPPEPREKSTDA